MLAHVYKAEQEQGFRHSLVVRVGGQEVRALVDSGNLFNNVMSAECAQRMGITSNQLAAPGKRASIGTAKKGANLRILGQLKKPIQLQFTPALGFPTRPIVLEGLSMDFNICGPFLKKHGIDQLHSEDCLRIQGHKIPLSPEGDRIGQAGLFVAHDEVVPAMTMRLLPCVVPNQHRHQLKGRSGLVEGSRSFMEKTDIHPWCRAVQD